MSEFAANFRFKSSLRKNYSTAFTRFCVKHMLFHLVCRPILRSMFHCKLEPTHSIKWTLVSRRGIFRQNPCTWVWTSDLRPIFRTSELRPIFRTSDLRPIFRTSDLRPIFRTSDLRPIFRTSELRPIFRTSEFRYIFRTVEQSWITLSFFNRFRLFETWPNLIKWAMF